MLGNGGYQTQVILGNGPNKGVGCYSGSYTNVRVVGPGSGKKDQQILCGMQGSELSPSRDYGGRGAMRARNGT